MRRKNSQKLCTNYQQYAHQGGASARLSEVKKESRRDFTPTTPLIGSAQIIGGIPQNEFKFFFFILSDDLWLVVNSLTIEL